MTHSPTHSLAHASSEQLPQTPVALRLTTHEHDGFYAIHEPSHRFTVHTWLTPHTVYDGQKRMHNLPQDVLLHGYNPQTRLCRLQTKHGTTNFAYLPRREVEAVLGSPLVFEADHEGAKQALASKTILEHTVHVGNRLLGALRAGSEIVTSTMATVGGLINASRAKLLPQLTRTDTVDGTVPTEIEDD
jgi:hypothetical protein